VGDFPRERKVGNLDACQLAIDVGGKPVLRTSDQRSPPTGRYIVTNRSLDKRLGDDDALMGVVGAELYRGLACARLLQPRSSRQPRPQQYCADRRNSSQTKPAKFVVFLVKDATVFISTK